MGHSRPGFHLSYNDPSPSSQRTITNNNNERNIRHRHCMISIRAWGASYSASDTSGVLRSSSLLRHCSRARESSQQLPQVDPINKIVVLVSRHHRAAILMRCQTEQAR